MENRDNRDVSEKDSPLVSVGGYREQKEREFLALTVGHLDNPYRETVSMSK